MDVRPTRWRAVFATLSLFAAACAACAACAAPAPGDPIAQAADEIVMLAGEHRLLLLGEFHGTREIPQVVSRLAARYAADGPVVVGLEVDHREQAALDAYLRSDGGWRARATLEAGRFWRRPDDQHSALATHDLLDVVEHVRRLRETGGDVAVLAYDVSTDAPRPDRNWRDRAMATSVRAAFQALPRGRLLMLTGNVHAMKERPAYLPAEAPRPAGTWLHDLQPFSVRLMARSGHSWGCAARRCGPLAADGTGARTERATGAYDALVVLPRFTVGRLMGAAVTP